MGNEKRDFAPVVVKFGVAFALSVGGILYTLIINKRSKASESSQDHCKHLDCNKQVSLRSMHHQSSQSSLHFDPLETDKHEELHPTNNLVHESPKGYPRPEKDTQEQEIKNLRNTIKILKERESKLEIELLEYYGLKQQETAVMELQNRLKLNNMEAKIFGLKIESLQADNKRLEAQMGEYKKVVADFEVARTKIKMLKKKIKSEAEHNKKQILDFQQRVQKMQEDEHETGLRLEKLKGLELEVEELRKSNHDLVLENSELGSRLDSVQILATSVLEDAETEQLREECKNLKKQNEDLSKEIERLQADRCGDVEEVVYLKWINACLRYELRNYQPGPGKTTARDLSKTLSPKSEEKAKQMILEYANKEGGGPEKGINVPEIDSDRWSNSQGSIITDLPEFDESFIIDDPLPHKNNTKFFGKLMRVLKGKDNHNPNHHHRNHSRNSSGGDEINLLNSPDNLKLRTSSGGGGSFKHSTETQKLTHRHSDSSFYKELDSIGGRSGRRSCSSTSGGPKSEIAKYAEALKDSRIPNFKSHRSSSSLEFF